MLLHKKQIYKNFKNKYPLNKFITTYELKDPVVFEYYKNNVIRIITKLETEDDQSYLDPNLVNETLN